MPLHKTVCRGGRRQEGPAQARGVESTATQLTENELDGVGVVEGVGVALDVKDAVIDLEVLGVGEADAVGDCVDVELAGMGTTAMPR